MTQNVVTLLIVLVVANVILISIAIGRSLYRRRRLRLDAPPSGFDPARVTAAGPARASAAPTTDGRSATTRTDPLTGLLLPGEWNRIVADEAARIMRDGRSATVVMLELDGLDRLVGALGNAAGDRVLPALADTLSRNARGADHLARLGVARFAVLLPETGEIEAVNYVERVREASDLWLESGAIALRLAIGWASPEAGTSLADAAARAQDRMFAELRRNARLAVAVAPDGPPPMGTTEGSPAPA
jgi:diguanylate cyclase (GGDEF)-like protein